MNASRFERVVALSGGVGGARFADGLARVLPAGALTVVVNTGDDFRHWGLSICPDLDTVTYTLAGLGDEARGWGLADESFRALEMMRTYGGEAWFSLGDRDLATHLFRTERLARGESLTRVTRAITTALGVPATILPMADEPRATWVTTEHEGAMLFNEWFVRRRTEPKATAVEFVGAREATAEVLDALERADLVVIGPSNPFVSIDPILTLHGVRERVRAKPVVAVSPIVAGAAVKGPLAAMLRDIDGRAPSPGAVAAHYDGLVGAWVVERGDERDPSLAGARVCATDTVMRSRDDRERLARETLAFAAEAAS